MKYRSKELNRNHESSTSIAPNELEQLLELRGATSSKINWKAMNLLFQMDTESFLVI